jgi:hypothetical protein
MRKLLLLTLAILTIASSAFAGAKLQINDEASIDLGFRIQYLMIHTGRDLDGDGTFDGYQDMKLRRGRIRLTSVVNPRMNGFLQTEIGAGAGDSGQDMRVIDAWINYVADPWAQVFMGLNMVPSNRQNLTSSGALMAMDRPGLAYKSLTWGGRALSTFSNSTYGASDSSLRGEGDVRDYGITLFGAGKVGDSANLKYYLGVYDGIQPANKDAERYAGRLQLNFGDAEGAYYNSSTYLGKKNTIGLGVSFDSQSSVGVDTGGADVDYSYVSFDGFLEKPLGGGTITLEGGYSLLDFGDAIMATGLASDGVTVLAQDLRLVQGAGYYVQAGYLVGGAWQPWAEYEAWASDDAADAGSYTSMRFGVTYFVQGHNANLKAGVELFKPEIAFTPQEDTLTSAVFGAFMTY